jgi:nicotinic acid mononucleotide adenylyltransferase
MKETCQSNCNISEVNTKIAVLEQKLDGVIEEQISARSDKYSFFDKITETQKILSERVVALETQYVSTSDTLKSLQKESSIQTKILFIILTAIIGGAVTIFFK